MPPPLCPKCQAPVSLPPGGAAADSVLRCAHCGSQLTLKRPERGAPERIGPYEITQVLGRGGMGIVYKGRDKELDRWIAIKTLLPALAADPEARERFKREARSAAPLSHPNLAQIYSTSEEGGIPYFAMEYIEGESLAQKLEREGRAKPLEAIHWVRQVALGLQEGQRLQLIHRDIKPANLILTADGTIKVTDFGLAKRSEGPASLQLTATGQAIGSPLFMSPEQARGAEVDHRSDIYSLGATFFNLLTGRPPFQGGSAMDILMKHIQEPAPSPRALNPAVSYPLAGLVLKMLRKRPEDRFPNYLSLIEELDRVEATERGSSTIAREPVHVWVREKRGASLASLVGIVALCAAAGLMAARGLRRFMHESRQESAQERRDRLREAAAPDPRNAEKSAADRGYPGLHADVGVGAASGPGESGEAPNPARLRISGLSQIPEPPAGMRVQGQLVNEGGGAARGASVEVRLFDGSGNRLASQTVLPQRDPIGGHEAAPFEAFFDDVQRVERVEAEVIWSR